MSVILFVRVSSDLPAEELEGRVLDRRPGFLEVPGLVQKIYGRDPDTGDEATEVRREVYQFMYPLRAGIGPLDE